MTIDEGIRLLTAIAALVGAIAGPLAVVLIQKVHKATNSLVDRLVLRTRKEALLEGHAAAVKEAKDLSDADRDR